jgi:sulfatase maturation enzyme AslB (radical SAM superfamily)
LSLGPDFARLDAALPIFGARLGARYLVYTPGLISSIAAPLERLLGQRLEQEDAEPLPQDTDLEAASLAARLRVRATQVAAAWRSRAESPFEPECLAVHLSNRCELECRYCYSRALGARDAGAGSLVPMGAVRSAARLIAASAAAAGRAFRLVIQGGGEPTLEEAALEQVVEATREIAREHGVRWWGHLSTSGVMPEARARWVARHFDSVGLSCDGPASLHDAQRPLRGAKPSYPEVECTAHILLAEGARMTVRATVTRQSAYRQREIVGSLCERLGARSIRVEPAYASRGAAWAFGPEDADPFVAGYLEAERVAESLGSTLSTSLVRLGELHGPHCDPARGVVRLLPSGAVAVCFLCLGGDATWEAARCAGRWDAPAEALALDTALLNRWKRASLRIPSPCSPCVAQYHCTRGCPDGCIASADGALEASFACRASRSLCQMWLARLASKCPIA